MLFLEDLAATYGPRTLWRNLSAQVEDGTMTAVVGASGSGKSTLLNYVGLLARPAAGRIRLDATELTALGPGAARRFRRDRLGYLFQNYALIEDATVEDNLALATRAAGRRGRAGRVAREAALEQVGLAGRGREGVTRLSGGEQQRVALARLLVKRPSLVLADEPTGALDADNTGVVLSLLRGLAQEGATVLIATHDDQVRDACDGRISLMDDQPVASVLRPPSEEALASRGAI